MKHSFSTLPHGRRQGSARPAHTGLALLCSVSSGSTVAHFATNQVSQPRPAGLALPGLLAEMSL